MKLKKLFTTAIICLYVSINSVFAQNIFPEKYEGCNTDQFAMESDTTTAKINSDEFIAELKKYLGEDIIKKIKGKLQLQIIVDLEGKSCLLSLENNTNIKSKKLDLKPWIDEQITWKIPAQKVSAIVVLEFSKSEIRFKRMGMDGKKGWHYLDH